MRIIDEITNREIIDPDLTAGYLAECNWASPEAYETIDNVTKFALDDSDYETVQLYHRWTAEEITERDESDRYQEHQDIMNALPDAVAELSVAVSDGATDTQDLADALADLSEIVSTLVEGA